MTRVMYIECSSGVAGDMLLGALIDAGLPVDALTRALGTLGVGHELRVSKVVRAGLSATKVDVLERPEAAVTRRRAVKTSHAHVEGGKVHTHALDGAPHQSLAEITHLIEHAALPKPARAKAMALFKRLAEVEAGVHRMSVDQVHLHEVGSVDSIIDIVGCVFGLEWFGVDRIVVSPLNVGSGTVTMAHGKYPVPAPATLQLLAGLPIYAEGPAVELTTPTGALLVGGHADAFGSMPAMVVSSIGYGAGTKDFADRPNVVRVVVGTAALRDVSLSPDGASPVVKIECEIDDMSPQLFGPVFEILLGMGALDVYLTSVQMKKQRPGVLLTVIAPPAKRELLTSVIFDHTTTIGVRYSLFERDTLARRSVQVPTPFGEIRMKVATRDGEVVNAVPEFEDCLRAATAHAVPIKVVQAQAMRAWLGGGVKEPISERRTARRPSPRRASRSDRAAPRGRSAPRGKR